ncbi:MAG: aminopeptidase P family protein [Candidatus Thermoplasmatota archaeon]|nr:aminopeptidase P family protein [Candidatus Thermoplasmatota archaeon]
MSPKRRLARFTESMQNSFDGALITPSSNLFYLTGMKPGNVMERLFLAVVYPQKAPSLIAPKLFEDEIHRAKIDFGDIYLWEDTDDPYVHLRRILKDIEASQKNLLIEDSMASDILMNIREQIDKYEWSSLNSQTSRLRKIKSEEEMELMKKAAEIADKTYREILKEDLRGMSEKELASLIDYIIKKNGAKETSFETIVASGPNSANPHHTPSDRKIQEKDMVIMDFGARYEGYCSDITRTAAIGDILEIEEKVYGIVKEAQSQARKIAINGIEARKIDKEAREIMKKNGYGENFTHRVGHGLGIDPHEEPYLTENNEGKIKKGMTFTIEPGIYLKDRFGVRIEDDMWMDEEKSITLTEAERDLKRI